MQCDASTVTEFCVTGSMRTTPSLSMRAGIQTVPSSKVSKVTTLIANLVISTNQKYNIRKRYSLKVSKWNKIIQPW